MKNLFIKLLTLFGYKPKPRYRGTHVKVSEQATFDPVVVLYCEADKIIAKEVEASEYAKIGVIDSFPAIQKGDVTPNQVAEK